MIGFAFQIFLNTILLSLSLWIVERHHSDYSFRKVCYVLLGIGLMVFTIDQFLLSYIGFYVLIPEVILATILLARYCYVSIAHALLAIILCLLIKWCVGLVFPVTFPLFQKTLF